MKTCPECSTEFAAALRTKVYCSDSCKERAQHRRIRADEARWERIKQKARERYVPTGKPPGPRPIYIGCSVAGCEGKHLARGLCRKHYYKDRRARGLDGGRPRELVSALVKRYDADGRFLEAATPLRLTCKVTAGVIPECPDCRAAMFLVNHDKPELRDCPDCRVRVLMNAEEVACLISAARSTAAPKRTANSSHT